MDAYATYLDLLRQLTYALEQLSGLAQKKIDATRKDDLNALDLVLKQEQAISLSMRSLERKRQRTLEQLHLEDVPLSRLAAQYPQEMRMEAKNTVEDLRRQYQIYRSVSHAARDVLESNLHEIAKVLKDEDPSHLDYSGSVELPSQLRTDIRD
jgi:hypothetical protein